jgi:hypothetical protein
MGAGGQWAAGEGVADGAHGFRVEKIYRVVSEAVTDSSIGLMLFVVFGAKILTHHST